MVNSSGYINTKFLLPTSNDVERLFSMTKIIFNTKRRSLNPLTLEALVFLKRNRSLWNLAQVGVVVNEISGEDDLSYDESTDDDRSDDEFDVDGSN